MEKSIMDLMAGVKEIWELPDVDVRTYSPLVLAYIGDAVYEVVVVPFWWDGATPRPTWLHKEASTLVNAGAQSASLERIKEELTEEEMQVFKRGRNANSATMAKHATMSDYRRATGFEALMGYLYLTGRTERILELAKKGLEED